MAAGESEPLAIGVVYMKFFVDTADVAEIKDLAASGLLDGVTTNPSLIMKSGRPILEVIKEICAIVPGPVSAETVATDHKTMLEEGRKLAKIAKNVAVKVPLTPDGLKTCKALSSEGTMVNVTLCFSAAQALLAAKAGATFISPFVGRLDDIGQDGMELIAEIMTIYRQYPHFKTEVLVASVRHPARHRGRQAGRPCRHPAAQRAAPALQASADRQRPEGLPRRLGQDRSVHPLTRSDIWAATARSRRPTVRAGRSS